MTVHVLDRTVCTAKIVPGRTAAPGGIAGAGARVAGLAGMAICSIVLAVWLAGPWIGAWHQSVPYRH